MIDSPVLVLNQNYQPLNVCNAKRALVLLGLGKAELMANGRGEIHTVSRSFLVPSVIRLFHMVSRPLMHRRLSRRSIFPPRRVQVPVLRPRDAHPDTGPHHPAVKGRRALVGERGQRLHTLQPPQGRPAAVGCEDEARTEARSPAPPTRTPFSTTGRSWTSGVSSYPGSASRSPVRPVVHYDERLRGAPEVRVEHLGRRDRHLRLVQPLVRVYNDPFSRPPCRVRPRRSTGYGPVRRT